MRRYFDIENIDMSLKTSQEEFNNFIALYLLQELGLLEEGEHTPKTSCENKHLTIYLQLRSEETYDQSITEIAAARTQAIADAILEGHAIYPYTNISMDDCWETITFVFEDVGEITLTKDNIVVEQIDDKIMRHFNLPIDLFN